MEKKALNSKEILDDDGEWVRYLLGQLPPEERDEVEKSCFGSEEAFERLCAVEADLMDSYVRGELGPDARAGFEQHLAASPRRGAKLGFATALNLILLEPAETREARGTAPRARPSRPQGERWAFPAAIAATVLLVVAGTWLAVQSFATRKEGAALRREQVLLQRRIDLLQNQAAASRGQLEELIRQAQPEKGEGSRTSAPGGETRAGAPRTVTFLLMAGLLRDLSAASRFEVPSGTDLIRLEIALETDDYEIYRVVIQKVTGEAVWKGDRLKARSGQSGRTVVAALKADLLPPGDYIVRLRGSMGRGELKSVEDYAFQIRDAGSRR